MAQQGTDSFQVELVWNRGFHFVRFGDPHPAIEQAIKAARDIEDSGDGARVKKTRILDQDDRVVWEYGKQVQSLKP